MSDLGLGIEYSDVLEATKAVVNLEDSYARMVQQIIAENNRLKVLEKNADLRAEAETRALKKIEQEAQKHHTKMLNDEAAFQRRREAQAAKEFSQLRRQAEEENRIFDQQARDAERAKDAYLSLAGRYDPLVRGVNEFARAQDTLQEALRRDIITLDQYWQKLDMVSEVTLHGAGDFTQFGAKALLSGKNLGYFGMVTQQAGYQLQDFFVQVQSGTSPLVALGQQGSQMAGIFGPGGAVFGALLAVGTALAGVILHAGMTKKSFKDLTEDFKTNAESMEESGKRLADSFEAGIISSVVKADTALQAFLKTWNAVDQAAFNKSAKAVKEGFLAPLAATGTTPTSFGSAIGTQLGAEKFGVKEVETAKELLAIYGQIGGVTRGEWVESLKLANAQILINTELTSKEKSAQLEKLVGLAKELGLEKELDAQVTGRTEKAKAAREDELAYVDALIEKYATQYEEEISYREQANQMAREFRIADAKAEEERLRKAYEYYADSRKAGVELAKIDLASALAGATENANGLATAMFNALGYAASIKALFSFGSTTTYGEVFQGPSVPAGWQEERDRLQALGAPPQFEDPDLDGLPGVTPDPKKGGGGGGKSSTDRLAELEREYQQRLKMAGLFGEQLKQEEAYQAVTKAVGDDIGKYSEEFLRAKAAELAATQELIDLEASRKEIYDTVESAMSDMFMSMADGTKSVKEAFSDMARSIISELYKVLVVKQAVNAIMGFVGGSGIIPGMVNGGNTVTKVNDAVISPKGNIISTSPEDFLIATKKPANLAKAMGNSNSSSISEGTVTVNQSFNISGSDQATVQQALTRAMPAIVTATKSAIVDARRRGSSDLRGAF